MDPQEKSKLEVFYESLVKAKYNVPDYNTFEQTLQDTAKARTFYDALSNANYKLPDYETFSTTLGLKKKEVPYEAIPSKQVLSDMYETSLKEESETSLKEESETPDVPDTSLETPEPSGYPQTLFKNVFAESRAKNIDEEKFKRGAQERIAEIDKELETLPKAKPQVVDVAYGSDVISKTPEEEKKQTLFDEKQWLKEQLTTPTKGQYIWGRAYGNSILGKAVELTTGTTLGSQEWLNKYDASTLTDLFAGVLQIGLLDSPVFGGFGSVGGKIASKAAKPLVSKVLKNTTDKFIKWGADEATAKAFAKKASGKLAGMFKGVGTSSGALGGYDAVIDALYQYTDPDIDPKDVDIMHSLGEGLKGATLGTALAFTGMGSAAIASKARAIGNTALRTGAQAGIAGGGLAVESAVFVAGDQALEGKNPLNISKEVITDMALFLTGLKVGHAVRAPGKTFKNIYQSLKYDSGKPGMGIFKVDLQPWEIAELGEKDYNSLMKDLAKDKERLIKIVSDEKTPALLKQKLLWGSQGLQIDKVNLYADKVEADGDYVNLYNKEGVLVDRHRYSDRDMANQYAIEMGIQLEDNKMQMNAAMPEVDRAKLLMDYKTKGGDVFKLLNALDKPAGERSAEEWKIVGDWYSMIPKPKDEQAPQELEPKKEEGVTDAERVTPEVTEGGEQPQGLVEGEEAGLRVRDVEEDRVEAREGEEVTPQEPVQGTQESTALEQTEKPAEVETPPVEKKKKIPKAIKAGSRTAKALNVTPNNFEDAVMQFFIRGGRISKEDFIAHSGWGEADIRKSGLGFMLSNKGQKLDVFHEVLENSFGIEEQGPMDMINAIIDVVTQNPNRASMLRAFEKRQEIEQPFMPTEEQIADMERSDKISEIIRNNGGLNIEAMEELSENGLISKEELETFKKELENENIEREQSEREWAEEEARIESERGTDEVLPSGEQGEGKERAGQEGITSETKDEKQIQRPATRESKEGTPVIPRGTAEGEGKAIGEGEAKPEEPVEEEPEGRLSSEQKTQIDKITKEYNEQIAEKEALIPKIEKDMRTALLKADERNGLFGDTAPLSPDEIIKREEQGFVYTDETSAAVRKPFEEKIAETRKQIIELTKERDSKIGEVKKQMDLFAEKPKAEAPEKKGAGETPLYKEAEKILAEETTGRKLAMINELINTSKDIEGLKSLQELPYVKQSMELPKEINSRIQYLERHPELLEKAKEEPKPPTTNKVQREALDGFIERLQSKGGTYVGSHETSAGLVVDYKMAGDKTPRQATIFKDGQMEAGKYGEDSPESFKNSPRAKNQKKLKSDPLTDKPEELAWDEPLPLSPAEDPNFKMSDLNNAMSIRTIAKNFLKNMGLEEGADVRTGLITRFSRKARALFNPRSGIVRVKNIRDLRALAHEIGHKIDFEIFDIRGIVSARAASKNLGPGIDFNGKLYTTAAQVDKAMKDGILSVGDGNFLMPQVQKYEKNKGKEKYSEIVEAGRINPVRFRNKTYKTEKDINDAVKSGVMPQTKGTELINKLNSKNKGRDQKLKALRDKYGADVVDGVLQRDVMKKELDGLLKDIGYPSKERTEGIAEFVYNYVMDPKQLINSTPNTLAWFEKLLDNAPEVKNALHKLRENFADYDSQDVLTKAVAEIRTPEKEKTPWLDGIVKIKDKILYSGINQLQYLKNLSEEWMKIPNIPHPEFKNPWIAAKELIGIDGKAQQWLLHNPYFKRLNEIVFRKDIPGLLQTIKPLIGTPEYEAYKAYLIALDSIESHNREKPQQAYFDKETAQAVKSAAEKRFGAAKLMEFQGSIQKYNEALIDFAVESGRFSKETGDYWKQEHQNYVPLKRIAEEYEIMGGKKKISRDMLPESEQAIFSRKGSEKALRDIFESMIENTYKIIASSERNLLNRSIADAFIDIHNYNRENKVGSAVIEEIDARGIEAYRDPTTGEIRYAISKQRPPNFRKPKGRIMVVYEKGVPKFYDVAPEYYDPIFQATWEVSHVMQKILKVASAPSRWLQAGAIIYDPTFPVRNIIRDQISAWFYSKHKYLPTEFIRGLASYTKKDEYYQKWLASGGDQSFLVSADMMVSEDFMSKKIGPTMKRRFYAYRKNPLLALQDFSKASEIGTRLGAFRNAYKKTNNIHLAAVESRDIAADYGIKGAAMRGILPFFPFLNARTQHARMTVEAMKNPLSFMAKGMAITIPALLNWIRNNSDEESKELYQSLPTWRRVGLFNIRIPGTDHFLPLPKGFFGVLFGSSVESVLDNMLKEDPRVLKELPEQLFQEFSPIGNLPELMPFPGRPPLEMWANKKGYTGKPIVSESMELLKPSEQYYNSTPEIMKKMGEALNWSPVKIEHYFRSYTGGAGIGAVHIFDEVLQAMGLVDRKPEDRFTTLSRMPVFKALLTEKPIGLQSGYVSDFYETLDKIEQVTVTFNKYVKTENYDELDRFMQNPENERMYAFYEGNSTALNAFRSALTYVRNAGYAVMKDDLLTNSQKQEEVMRMNEIVHETAIRFKKAYENNEFFDYGKEMDEIIKSMKDEEKDYRKDLVQQQQSYSPYWMQLRKDNKQVYDLMREFGGFRDIEQTRKFRHEGKAVDLSLEDVRRFNEAVVKRYGENVRSYLGTKKDSWESYNKRISVEDVNKTDLQIQFDRAWEDALARTNSSFRPTQHKTVK